MCGEIGTGPYEDLYVYESDRKIFYRNTCVGLGLHGQAFGTWEIQRWLLGEAAGSFLPVQQRQSLAIHRWKCHWPSLGQLEVVVMPP